MASGKSNSKNGRVFSGVAFSNGPVARNQDSNAAASVPKRQPAASKIAIDLTLPLSAEQCVERIPAARHILLRATSGFHFGYEKPEVPTYAVTRR